MSSPSIPDVVEVIVEKMLRIKAQPKEELVENPEEYVVEKILGKRKTKAHGVEYLIKWAGLTMGILGSLKKTCPIQIFTKNLWIIERKIGSVDCKLKQKRNCLVMKNQEKGSLQIPSGLLLVEKFMTKNET